MELKKRQLPHCSAQQKKWQRIGEMKTSITRQKEMSTTFLVITKRTSYSSLTWYHTLPNGTIRHSILLFRDIWENTEESHKQQIQLFVIGKVLHSSLHSESLWWLSSFFPDLASYLSCISVTYCYDGMSTWSRMCDSVDGFWTVEFSVYIRFDWSWMIHVYTLDLCQSDLWYQTAKIT